MAEQKKSPLPYDAEDQEELYKEMLSVASATECTGLMPTPPITEPEVDSYSDIYDVPLAKDPEEAKSNLQSKKKTNPL